MRTRTAIAAALLLATLTACSSDPATPAADKPNAPAEQPADNSKAQLEATVRAYSAAYFKPDTAAAYGMLSKRCAAKIPQPMYDATVKATVASLGKHEIKTLTVDQLSGDLARVTYTYDVPKLSQTGQPWAREGGVWKYDGC